MHPLGVCNGVGGGGGGCRTSCFSSHAQGEKIPITTRFREAEETPTRVPAAEQSIIYTWLVKQAAMSGKVFNILYLLFVSGLVADEVEVRLPQQLILPQNQVPCTKQGELMRKLKEKAYGQDFYKQWYIYKADVGEELLIENGWVSALEDPEEPGKDLLIECPPWFVFGKDIVIPLSHYWFLECFSCPDKAAEFKSMVKKAFKPRTCSDWVPIPNY